MNPTPPTSTPPAAQPAPLRPMTAEHAFEAWRETSKLPVIATRGANVQRAFMAGFSAALAETQKPDPDPSRAALVAALGKLHNELGYIRDSAFTEMLEIAFAEAGELLAALHGQALADAAGKESEK